MELGLTGLYSNREPFDQKQIKPNLISSRMYLDGRYLMNVIPELYYSYVYEE